ncbi:hybrid sensor histidine kinase/response regulator [Verrucomicrobium sp. BvORR034]|jgi:two-component system sensor histidine kinase/response regulator|uniref:hybrid sensor histidine kinase/response regulator n=1 Tax=Verrucomicrobium sp. BvORR034 TaxID=1396418 RepID=UPI0006788B36|nr:hybrid sensor histidine kinase/response regulator [Verrucomicrobium sp. BvORR034]
MTPTVFKDTILIIDDQEQNLQIVGTILSMMDYDIIPALSGEQAFKRLAIRKPDLILLDVMMPEMDGLEVCRRLQANSDWSGIPVIFLSAADDKNLIVQALETGGVDYVTKPFNRAELLSRVRTHLALKHARDDLRLLAEDKDELLGILAHDLKNHLAGMKLSTKLLQDRVSELPPRSARLVDNIHDSTERMLVFVKEFLANQLAENLKVDPTPIDLKEILTSVGARHEPIAAAKQINIVLELAPRPVTIKGDHEMLEQALENVVSNAIKFSPVGTTITLRAKTGTTGYAVCEVADQGPGFTNDDMSRMFRRYGRLSARPTGGEPSTGLGLSIVKRLIERMGGTIRMISGPGEGAVFSLQLPLAIPETLEQTPEAPSPTANLTR